MRAVSILASVLMALVVAYAMLWGSLALWFRLPAPTPVVYTAMAIFLFPGLLALVHVFSRRTWRSLAVFGALLAAILIWWQTLRPPVEGNWQASVARQVTGTIEGDILTLDGVRAFEWRTPDDYTEVWQTRSYDLTELETVDLFLSYWGDPRMAHFMLSFGFADGENLAWSVEVRREQGDEYSPVNDFFKEHTLSIIAAEEYDVVGLRSNIWENDVHIFQIRDVNNQRRGLLEGYVADANRLAEQPAWYNSIFTNCTTVVFKTMETMGLEIPFDWRIIVNGYLPEFLYDRASVNTDYSAQELRDLGRITDRALQVGLGPGYSEAIRQGLPPR